MNTQDEHLEYSKDQEIHDLTDIINSLEDEIEKLEKQLILNIVSRSKRFDKQDLLNGYQAGCIEGLDDCCDLGLDYLNDIKQDSEKWFERYTE